MTKTGHFRQNVSITNKFVEKKKKVRTTTTISAAKKPFPVNPQHVLHVKKKNFIKCQWSFTGENKKWSTQLGVNSRTLSDN